MDFRRWDQQNVLHASLLIPSIETDEPTREPSEEEAIERYGPLFGTGILEKWEEGGREIWDAIPGRSVGGGGDDAMEE
jgi:hypothetical protein